MEQAKTRMGQKQSRRWHLMKMMELGKLTFLFPNVPLSTREPGVPLKTPLLFADSRSPLGQHQAAPVHIDRGPGDITAGIAGQKGDHVGYLFRFGEMAQRAGLCEHLLLFRGQ